VWSQPLAAELLGAADGALPAIEDVIAVVFVAEPDLAPATARRRASAVRALIAPAVGLGPHNRSRALVQLDLPLAHAPTAAPAPRLQLAAGKDWNPDVYRYLLQALLDYGELALGQVRALLDRGGADELPLGGYVDMALARGDASRRSECLVVTDDAIARKDLVESTGSIILSDPQYRAYLQDAVDAVDDRQAEIRRDELVGRFRVWDRRVFGHALRPAHVREDLERVLMDRSLATFPIAVRDAPERAVVEEPFLDAWTRSNLAICCPPYLAQLQGGIAGVNRVLRRTRQGAAPVSVPDISYRPVLVHGGLIHPGEPLPRSVPDTRSLRLRVLLCAPYPSLLGALLLLHRTRPDRADVVRKAAGWEVRWRRKRMGSLLDVIDQFAASRGWAVARRPGGLPADTLMHSIEAVGIAWVNDKRAVLEEKFFGQLRRQPEEFEVFERLQPLAVAFEDWLDQSGPGE
jgi:hypothetical protein